MNISVILSGCTGTMGQELVNYIKTISDINIVAGVCRNKSKYSNSSFPLYDNFLSIKEKANVIIDFSNRCLIDDILNYGIKNKIGLVLATTGYSMEEEEKIFEFSKKIPVFRSSNLSVGVSLTLNILEYAVKLLSSNYDIEIIESHGNKKVDAPSGTAKMIKKVIENNINYNPNYIYNRNVIATRKNSDIGIHSIRAGNMLGNHLAIFAGEGDVIKVEHITLSKKIFAEGAISAVRLIQGKHNGYFIVDDLLDRSI
ncbi:4-hydroxy-tetrahydrodipicolinate reductase [Sedimentibacter sp. zth1]|uniref:4-hydroxy-tetrahydrodipicolinate reductase n=1 Tax=Sedimentibacter sp. zth1 TaxID=2816908 RepID=UPI001A921D1B|nr:4-hydroxy-tetrahydrodipicolinate reductase [Sedimentibacter sp. zth1]QSX05128.1 4-hydroxy-tetrahydrodipicolinate reductase [Sedimentibacter sp. zth1]